MTGGPIPSGATVVGLAYFDSESTTNGDFRIGVPLPATRGRCSSVWWSDAGTSPDLFVYAVWAYTAP